ncbi:hypothetical protein AVEN_265818-1 [Araneus ventricosus]|uniref:HTH CENPB-type domain-containing protein n=1 Tax=Araneus ventricosus TaxID=182803 RepID=A0A4Y2DWE0_ARAVE|nr:hypothetical protein AVEN_265818-1 [Araneus ventricosus]
MGAILQAKANELTELFEEKSFVCSNEWLDRFRKWNNIRSGKVVGEAASVSSSDIKHWMENVWPETLFAITMKRKFSMPMKQVCDISLLDAVVLLEKSWRLGTESTIRNSFIHVGLTKTQQTEDDGEEDDNLPLSKWLKKHGVNAFSQNKIEHFECCDDMSLHLGK